MVSVYISNLVQLFHSTDLFLLGCILWSISSTQYKLLDLSQLFYWAYPGTLWQIIILQCTAYLFFKCIIDFAHLAFVGDSIIIGIALHIIPTYVTDYKVVTTNMPVKAVLWSAFLFLLKNFLFWTRKSH